MRVRINGQRLRLELARRGLDQAALARLAGVSEATVSHASTGRTVNPTTLQRITVALVRVPMLAGPDLIQPIGGADVSDGQRVSIL